MLYEVFTKIDFQKNKIKFFINLCLTMLISNSHKQNSNIKFIESIFLLSFNKAFLKKKKKNHFKFTTNNSKQRKLEIHDA